MMEPANSNGNLYQKDSNGKGSQSTIFMLFAIAAFIFGLLAFIIALVALTQYGGGRGGVTEVNLSGMSGQTSAQSISADDDKVWLLHIGHSGSNVEYIDEESGQMKGFNPDIVNADEESGQVKGFNPDIVNAVCRIANKNCKLVFDVYKNCWQNVAGETSRGGYGLMAGWFDACAAWRANTERKRTFAFSDIFSGDPKHGFFTLLGNTDGFNWRDLRGKKIGFHDGFSSNEHCIAATDEDIQGKELSADQIFHYHDFNAMVAALQSGEVDAILVSISQTRGNTDAEMENVSGDLNQCSRGGFGMMTRFDGKLIEWWNPAQEKLLASKEYQEICKDILEEHGGWPGQDPSELCIDYVP